eukprot:1159961-Pelagomonas_calceolata.AAC.5
MAEVTAQLNSIASGQDQKAKAEEYKKVLSKVLGDASVEGCRAFVDHRLLPYKTCSAVGERAPRVKQTLAASVCPRHRLAAT